MKITEITNIARKIIKEMESLYVSYCVNDSTKARDHLIQFIENSKLSDDFDVVKQAKIYESKLIEDLIRILKL